MSAGIRERIRARRDLDEARAQRDLDKMAAALNAERLTQVGERWVTGRTILDECPDGEAILVALEAAAASGSAATRWTVAFLQSDPGVNMGSKATMDKTDALVALEALTEDQAQQLKALAQIPVVVTRLEVEAALYNRDTTEK